MIKSFTAVIFVKIVFLMIKQVAGTFPVFFLLLFAGFTSSAQVVKEPTNVPADWSAPYPPFRIAGNLYYVGTEDLACYLITTTGGNILINTGLANSATIIKNNISSLGFHMKDIKILLTTQAHYDHLGAMADIKEMTGALFMANEKDAAVITDGGASDYAFGNGTSTFKPVSIDRMLHDNDTIRLGNMQLVMLHHPGHTKGSCSFLFTVQDEQRSYKVLIANIPTIVTKGKFNSIPAYPSIARDYAYTLGAMKNLLFDIWVASHASQFELAKKHAPGSPYRPEDFMDRKGYDEILNDRQKDYNEKMTEDKK